MINFLNPLLENSIVHKLLIALAILLALRVFGVIDAFSKVMFSPVRGVVLKDGKPVVGAVLKRSFSWAMNDKKVTDQAVTDDAGKFQFPLATRFSVLTSLLPHEPVIRQEIHIHHDHQEYVAWRFFKHNYENNGEWGGKNISMICELSQTAVFQKDGDFYGIAKIIVQQ